MLLLIDTSSNQHFTVALARPNGVLVYTKVNTIPFSQAEKLLPLIDTVLKRNNINLKKISGIIVVTGPGDFTALRIGVSTANALSYALAVPVAGYQANQFDSLEDLAQKGAKEIKQTHLKKLVFPKYGKRPNITKPKKVLTNILWIRVGFLRK